MNKKLLRIAMLLLLFACNQKKEATYVNALKEIQQLATAEYIVTKVVKADDNKAWYKLGDRKILISCKATLKAGIDFTKLKKGDIKEKRKKLFVLLPQPQILSLSISPEDISVEYVEVTLMRDNFTNADRDALLAQAESQIRKQADSLGILTTAKENAASFVRSFFKNTGFEEVEVNFKNK
ncbi:MAG: DUF4230 domain-containing protein [Chitinophagaceae bacterium]